MSGGWSHSFAFGKPAERTATSCLGHRDRSHPARWPGPNPAAIMRAENRHGLSVLHVARGLHLQGAKTGCPMEITFRSSFHCPEWEVYDFTERAVVRKEGWGPITNTFSQSNVRVGPTGFRVVLIWTGAFWWFGISRSDAPFSTLLPFPKENEDAISK